jgi:hypothetical protein
MKRTSFSSEGAYARILAGSGSGMMNGKEAAAFSRFFI